MINKSNIGEVTIEEKGFKLTIKQKEEPVQQLIAAPMQQAPISYSQSMPSVQPAAATTTAGDKPKANEAPAGLELSIEVQLPVNLYLWK